MQHLINLLRRQSKLYAETLLDKLAHSQKQAEVYGTHSSVLKEFYKHAFLPISDDTQIREFDMKATDALMKNTKADMDIAYEELGHVSSVLQDAYNANKDYRTSVKNRIQYLSGIVSDLNIMSGTYEGGFTVFKDSLTNHDFIDKEFITGSIADISTSEGIAHLAISSDKTVTEEIDEIKIYGNGAAGNGHVAKRVDIETVNPEYNIYAKYRSEDDAHDNEATIADGAANTWFEYQKIGVPDSYRSSRFDVEWAEAGKVQDELVLKVTLKLKAVENINWIGISPYLPERSRSPVKVYSVKVSEEGSEYTSIYKDKAIMDSEINLVPQRYLSDPLFENDTVAKFASQGVFVFPQTKAKYVEIILKQDKPYDEFIGNTYYKEISGTGDNLFERLIPEDQVPNSIRSGPTGRYRVDGNKTIVKGMEVVNGWRYCIGLREIEIYDRKFEKQSEFVTKKFSVAEPIYKVILHANEIIPDEYMEYGLEKRNTWIKYYISINDTDWYPISPMHHNRVGDLKIPPKIYEINSVASSDEKMNSVNKGYLSAEGDEKNIRLKAVFARPQDLQASTPILEEYGLQCFLGGVSSTT